MATDNKIIDAITKKAIETNRKAGKDIPAHVVREQVVRHAIRRDIQGKNK
jgi:hypothetical protein